MAEVVVEEAWTLDGEDEAKLFAVEPLFQLLARR